MSQEITILTSSNLAAPPAHNQDHSHFYSLSIEKTLFNELDYDLPFYSGSDNDLCGSLVAPSQ